MSRYLLDNGVLVAYLKGRPGALQLVDPWIAAGEAATSLVVYGEAIEYLRGRHDFAMRRAELRRLLQTVIPYRPTYPILERYADLRRTVRLSGLLRDIGDFDGVIAATALVHGLTVVTLDKDFTRVPGLTVMLLERDALQ